MHLTNAELQQTTGHVIAKGQFLIGSEADTTSLGISKHDRLIIWMNAPVGLTIWSAIDVVRDENGFFRTTLGEAQLTFPSLIPGDITDLAFAGSRSFTRSGYRCGSLRCHRRPDGGAVKQPQAIHAYELTAEYGAEGLHFAVSGQFTGTSDQCARDFSLDATVSWETLTVKGFQAAAAYWKFGHTQGLPARSDRFDRPRDPLRLGDLSIAQGLSWPYLEGQLQFTPEVAWPPARQRDHQFLSIHFDDWNQMKFWDATRVEFLDNGFARSSALHRNLILTTLGRGQLELEFRRRDTLSVQLEGDALGSVRYQTGYPDEPGDPFGWISQPVKTASLRLALGRGGLALSADGELGEFDVDEFARHRKKRNSQLKPLKTYALRATMPWALLAARGFGFADRAKDF
jgi:hypothetical protein